MLIALPLLTAISMTPDADRAAREPVRLRPYPQLIATRFTEKDGLPPGGVSRLRIDGKQILARMEPDGQAAAPIWVAFDGKRWTRRSVAEEKEAQIVHIAQAVGAPVTSLAKTRSGQWWVVTENGAFRLDGDRPVPLELPRNYRYRQPTPNQDLEIRFVISDASGHVWLATNSGACATDGADWWQPLDREDGMPYEDMLCLAIAPNGDLWGGTTQGAWRLRNGQWRYFWGPRWMPGNRVNSIAVDAEGSVWLATDKGVAKIEERMMRLADKAAHYEQITNARHNRRGWVTGCSLKTPGDPSGGFVHHASDNDGLWTAIYIAAEAFRYGATKDPEARRLAKKSMEALLDLVRLSGFPGFPARAIIRKGEEVSGYDPDETVRVPGETDKIWYTSPVDPNLLVKGDTSSDELDGHYFAWYIYHEIVADEADKKALREVVRAVTNNILDHEYTLVGHTGRKTRWGVFGPQYLNEDPRWWEERGLNSAELLCYLKVAHHICGDQRFADAYEDLIANHHYLLNTLYYRAKTPWYAINHSDDELAYCVYYPLLMLERRPERRAVLTRTIASTWYGGPITPGLKEERGPFYNFIFGATTGAPCQVEEAVATLQEWPWELIHWEIRNSHRHDVTFRTGPGILRREIDRVLPASERWIMRWNGNPWSPDRGGNGESEEDGAAWLLPYWMGRYHGFITE